MSFSEHRVPVLHLIIDHRVGVQGRLYTKEQYTCFKIAAFWFPDQSRPPVN